MIKRVYLDYAATTPLDKRVLAAMQPYLAEKCGNSTGLHSFALEMKNALEASRAKIAKLISARESELVFTASATEANNMALKGVAFANQNKGRHIIISSVEHASIHETCLYLQKSGFDLTFLPVNEQGFVHPENVRQELRSDTILVSVIYVNNELGVIEPIADIGKICRSVGVYFHCDAVQGFGKLPIHVNQISVDLLSASSHKIYGAPGAGLLFVRSGVQLEPLLHGGGQENGRRASTVNVAAVVGFAKALEIYEQDRDSENPRILMLRNKLQKYILERIPNAQVNGNSDQRISHILNVSFKNTDGELLAIQLDQKGIAVSTGASCSTGKIKESRILSACKVHPQWRRGAIRFSLGRFTSEEEIEYVMDILPAVIKEVKKIS